MLLLSPLGSVKSKLIVLQDRVECVSKSSCWSCLQLLHQPGSLLVSSYWLWAIEFRALEVAPWKKPSVTAWQLCHCKVTERALQSPNPIRALFGTFSITGENPTEQGGSQARLLHPASSMRQPANVSIFVSWAIRNTLCCHEAAKQLVQKGPSTGL